MERDPSLASDAWPEIVIGIGGVEEPCPISKDEVGKGEMICDETKGELNDVSPSEFMEITPEIGFGRGGVPGPCPIRIEAEVKADK